MACFNCLTLDDGAISIFLATTFYFSPKDSDFFDVVTTISMPSYKADSSTLDSPTLLSKAPSPAFLKVYMIVIFGSSFSAFLSLAF